MKKVLALTCVVCCFAGSAYGMKTKDSVGKKTKDSVKKARKEFLEKRKRRARFKKKGRIEAKKKFLEKRMKEEKKRKEKEKRKVRVAEYGPAFSPYFDRRRKLEREMEADPSFGRSISEYFGGFGVDKKKVKNFMMESCKKNLPLIRDGKQAVDPVSVPDEFRKFVLEACEGIEQYSSDVVENFIQYCYQANDGLSDFCAEEIIKNAENGGPSVAQALVQGTASRVIRAMESGNSSVSDQLIFRSIRGK